VLCRNKESHFKNKTNKKTKQKDFKYVGLVSDVVFLLFVCLLFCFVVVVVNFKF